jgi:hypothetical protein
MTTLLLTLFGTLCVFVYEAYNIWFSRNWFEPTDVLFVLRYGVNYQATVDYSDPKMHLAMQIGGIVIIGVFAWPLVLIYWFFQEIKIRIVA